MDRTDYYREIADRYLNLNGSAFAAGYQRNRFETFNALLPPRDNLRMFDFCCGSGESIVELSQRGHEVSGSDLSAVMLEKARLNVAAAGLPPRDLRLGGVELLAQLPGESYDVLGALNVLPYLTEAEEAAFFTHARHALKPGGCLIVSHTNML